MNSGVWYSLHVCRAVLMLPLVACVSPLPEPFVVNDLRIVAMIAEPPEVAPDSEVTMHVYFAHPGSPSPHATLTRCPDAQAFACDEEVVLDAGRSEPIGESLSRVSFTIRVPADAAAGNAVVLVHANSGAQQIDGMKRVVVSTGFVARNQNPVLKDLYVLGGGALLGGITAPPVLERGTEYQALPVYDAETLEPYVVDFDDGTRMATIEQPFFSWSCVGACSFDTPLSYDFQSVRLTPRAETEKFSLYLVMRDGRGGEAFLALECPTKRGD